jgi:hypothetical protein
MWNWLNGKKSNIALILFLIQSFGLPFVEQILMKTWGIDVPVFEQISETIAWIAGALGTVGVVHKGYKVKKNRG